MRKPGSKLAEVQSTFYFLRFPFPYCLLGPNLFFLNVTVQEKENIHIFKYVNLNKIWGMGFFWKLKTIAKCIDVMYSLKSSCENTDNTWWWKQNHGHFFRMVLQGIIFMEYLCINFGLQYNEGYISIMKLASEQMATQ